MKLLVLSTWFPFPPDNGSRIRAYHLLQQLARRHEIRLIAGVQEDVTGDVETGVTELRTFCRSVVPVSWQWHDPQHTGAAGAVRALLSSVPRSILETPNPPLVAAIAQELTTAPDAVLVLELGMDAYLPALPEALPVIIDQVEVSGVERAYRQANGIKNRLRVGLTYRKSAAYWQKRFARYTAITAVSEEEAVAVRKVVGAEKPPVVVVPNGVSVSDYIPRPLSQAVPGRLIYNGALTYAPNQDAVRWFVRDILPVIVQAVPDAHLVVTGRYNASDVTDLCENPRVHLTGLLPDLRPTLAEAAVCVVPLLAGGGTRLKILEAWAAGLPVVSTSIGTAGLGAESGLHLLIADDANLFAEKVITLLTDSTQANILATHARKYVEAHFNWSAIGSQLSNLLEQAVQTP